MFSSSCEYGLRATMYLAAIENGDEYISIGRISEDLDISFHFLTKTFQKMTQAGLLESQRGPSGGVRLARDPEEITLRDIVFAIDGPGLFTECILGLPGCGDDKPCPLHNQWATERERLVDMLEEATLDQLVHDIETLDLRLRATLPTS